MRKTGLTIASPIYVTSEFALSEFDCVNKLVLSAASNWPFYSIKGDSLIIYLRPVACTVQGGVKCTHGTDSPPGGLSTPQAKLKMKLIKNKKLELRKCIEGGERIIKVELLHKESSVRESIVHRRMKRKRDRVLQLLSIWAAFQWGL